MTAPEPVALPVLLASKPFAFSTARLVVILAMVKALLTLVYEAALPAARPNLAAMHLALGQAAGAVLHVAFTIVVTLLSLAVLTALMQLVCASIGVPIRFATVVRWVTIAAGATIAASVARLIFLLTTHAALTSGRIQTVPGSVLYFAGSPETSWAPLLNLINPFEVLWCVLIALNASAVTTRAKGWVIATLTWLATALLQLSPLIALKLLR